MCVYCKHKFAFWVLFHEIPWNAPGVSNSKLEFGGEGKEIKVFPPGENAGLDMGQYEMRQ